jgi:AcrR family transcriptional regulator
LGRKYTLGKRAEQLQETRRRIVDATVDLHREIGPAATTISMIAERAGVQRHTLYAHFPDERSLQMACSGLTLERDPLPDAAAWASIDDPAARLRRGIGEVHGWYARNADLAGCVLRDAEHHALTREIATLRFGPSVAAWLRTLGEGLAPEQRALLQLALGYHTWRTLTRDAGLTAGQAVDVLVGAIVGAARRSGAAQRDCA